MAGEYDDLSFGQVALALGYVKADQLREFLKIQADYSSFKGQSVPLGQIMREAGAIDTRALNHILSELGQAKEDRTVHVQRLIMICKPCGKRYSLPLEYRDRKVSCNSCMAPLELEHKPTTERAAEEDVPTEVRVCARDTSNLFGHYTLVKEIGRGGMGVVYKAWDNTLKRYVALKFLQSASLDDIKRFEREAQSLAKLNHPNIAQVYEIGTVARKFFIAMQFIDGGSLGSARLGLNELIQKMIDVCYAIDYAHKHNIQHRDIKPTNIMVDKEGRVFVMDFGLAKQLKGKDLELSQTRQIVGTPQYMSPEQAKGEKTDARSDVYSLGATMYTLLTRVYPHDGKSVFAVLKHVVEKDVVPPRSYNPRVPWELETIILKAMEKDPLRRYQSARELAEDLQRLLNGEPVLAKRPTLTYRVKKTVARHKFATIAAALIIVLALGVVVLSMTMRGVSKQLTEEQSRATTAKQQKQQAGKVPQLAGEAIALIAGFDAALLAPDINIDVQKKNLSEAVSNLHQAIEIAEKAQLNKRTIAGLYTELGRAHARRDDYDASLEALRRSLEISRTGAAHYERGITYILMARVEEGRTLMPRQGTIDTASHQRVLELGKLAAEEFRACQQYEDIKKQAHRLEYARFIADVLSVDRRNPDELLERAAKVVELVKKLEPTMEADVLEQMSSLYMIKGDFQGAVEKLAWAAEIKRSDYRAHRSLALAHLAIGASFYKRALDATEYMLERALSDIQDNALPQLDAAIPSIKKAIDLRPDRPDTWLIRAMAYHMKVVFAEVLNRVDPKDMNAAIEDFTQVLKLNEELLEPRANRGHLYFSRGRLKWKQKTGPPIPDLDRAIEDYTTVLNRKANPEILGLRAEALYLKAIVLAEGGKPVQETLALAMRDTEPMLTDPNKKSAGHTMRGKIRLVEAQFALARTRTLPESELKQAWEEFDAAFRAKSDNWDALAYRGAVEFYLGQDKAAEMDLREAAKHKPLLLRAEFGKIYDQVKERLRRF